ncbi:MAG: AAA family ATPase [Rhizobiales bacterium]|nr:AAA family ATPase [Hyphomicrobiales bacterium]OJY44303.1 MAG: ATPase [Rhizobiales bacterium 64-17]
MSERFVVITGGPGAGKSSLIDALAADGFPIVAEAGRDIIRDQMARGGTALPWIDPAAFAQAMLDHDSAAYTQCAQRADDSLVFFDRGVVDIVGYLTLTGLPIPPALDRAARSLRYRPQVFIAPAWHEIYAQDTERKQDFDEARRTEAAMREVYPRYGYTLIDLPRASVAKRTTFIRRACGAEPSSVP